MINTILSVLLGVGALSQISLAGEEGKAGLPQLDLAWFIPQIFWLLVIFGLLYIVIGHIIAPKIGGVITMRNAKIADDLQRAEDLIKEATAQKIQAQSESADAQQQAKNEVMAALNKANNAIRADENQQDEKLQKIWADNAVILQNLRADFLQVRDNQAVDVAVLLVERVAGITVNPKDIKVKVG